MSVRKIFKAYDVRGAYPDDWNEEIAEQIGRAIADFLDCKNAVVGHDMRASAVPLSAALMDGLRAQGVDVTFIGRASSPMVYFAGGEFDCAVSVTASHNPPPDNGMKICAGQALPIGSANGLLDIADLVEKGSFREGRSQGSFSESTPREQFVDFSLQALQTTKPFHVVVDAGNGIGGLDYDVLAKRDIPLKITPMYFEPDDSFPHHEPNPLKFETLADLQKRVVEEGADLGVGLDGDGDRCVFVDEKGEIISADLMTALVAQDVLVHTPGATILYDLRSSRVVAEEIEKAGGRAVECRVGHAFIKKAMREENSVFAGELSGHFYFRESSYAENTLIALFRLLNLLEARGTTLSEAIAPLRRYHSSGEVNSRVDDVDAVLSALSDKYGDGDVSRLDGLKVSYEDWWFNVRPSNTEPVLRLVLEANDEATMTRRRDELLSVIRAPVG